MKLYHTTPIFLLLVLSCSTVIKSQIAADIKTHLETNNLKGSVSLIEQKEYDLDYDYIINEYRKTRTENGVYVNSKTAFNEIGNMLWNQSWKTNSSSRTEYYYDHKNRLIKQISIDNNIDSVLFFMKYNNQNLLIEDRIENSKGNRHIIKYKYNDAFKVIEKVKYDLYRNRIDSTIYEYNDAMSYETGYNFQQDDTLYRIERVQYDQDMRIVLIEREYRSNPNNNSREYYSHNEFGYVIEENDMSQGQSSPSKTVYKYTYDANNNWITRTSFWVYKHEIPSRIVERKISYYND